MSTPKLTQAQIIQVLPLLSVNVRNINVTSHAEERMRQRNISYDDILSALNNPKVLIDTRYDEKHKNYCYKVYGVDINKHIVLTIDGKTREIHIVTVINKLYNH